MMMKGNRRGGRNNGRTLHRKMMLLLLPGAASFRLAVVVVMLVGSVTAAAAVIVLQFDGSLRRSCHSNSGRGGGSENNAWISTCAASISVDGRLHGLGGRRLLTTTTLPIQGKSSSAAGSRCSSIVAEYEGLLYGLEQLAKFLHDQHDDDDDDNNNNNNHKRIFSNNRNSTMVILVQGDCKTVVEQMQGRARPRIMERDHQRATAIIDHDIAPFVRRKQPQQQQQSTTNNTNTNNTNTNSNVVLFQHIPRAQNTLADELADCIADQGRVMAVHEFLERLYQRFFFVPDDEDEQEEAEEDEDITATPSVRLLVSDDDENEHDDDDLLLLLLSRLDAPTQLVGLRCLAQQLLYGQHVRWKPSPPQHNKNNKNNNNRNDETTTADLLFGIADRIDALLSPRNADSQHALYHVDDNDKNDMAVRAYLCRQRALDERGDQSAIATFHRQTRHFARTRASDIDRLVVLEETEASSCSKRRRPGRTWKPRSGPLVGAIPL
jgi:ribonuclease HI